MALVLDFTNNAVLPGAPTFSLTDYGLCNYDSLLAPGSPITSGPAGQSDGDQSGWILLLLDDGQLSSCNITGKCAAFRDRSRCRRSSRSRVRQLFHKKAGLAPAFFWTLKSVLDRSGLRER